MAGEKGLHVQPETDKTHDKVVPQVEKAPLITHEDQHAFQKDVQAFTTSKSNENQNSLELKSPYENKQEGNASTRDITNESPEQRDKRVAKEIESGDPKAAEDLAKLPPEEQKKVLAKVERDFQAALNRNDEEAAKKMAVNVVTTLRQARDEGGLSDALYKSTCKHMADAVRLYQNEGDAFKNTQAVLQALKDALGQE